MAAREGAREGGFGSTGGGVMEDLRSGIEHLKQAKAHMSEANGIMSGHISKLKALEEENAELRAKLEAWIQSDDSYMKLPLDADGEPIRIGDEVNIDGDVMTVLGYRLHNDMLLLFAKDKKSGLFFTPKPSIVRHFKPEPADSWEKLEKDARKTACAYAPAPLNEDGLVTCDGCRFQKSESCSNEMTLDVVERAKKLAGIEEEARND